MNEPGLFALNWVFSDVDGYVDPWGPAGTVPDLPCGVGLVIGPVGDEVLHWAAEWGARMVDGMAEFPGSTVFGLSGGGCPDLDVLDGPVVPVGGIPGLRSDALAMALLAGSMPGVLSALASGVVLLPVISGGGWRMEVRLFQSANGSGSGDLCLFSSVETMEEFLGEGCGACFVVQNGAAVVEFLARHDAEVADVVFDPAGPCSLRLAGATMTGLADVDQVEVAALEEVLSRWSGPAVKGYDLPLGPQWGRVDCADVARRDDQIRVLVEARTRWMGVHGAEVASDMCSSLSRAAARAAAVGGTEMCFLWNRATDGSGSLDLVSYFHDLGQEKAGRTHLDEVEDAILDTDGPDQDVCRMAAAGGVMLRHCRPHHGGKADGRGAPGVIVDYWIPAPDGQHVAHLCFSTLDPAGKDSVTELTDELVRNGVWVIGDEPGGTPIPTCE